MNGFIERLEELNEGDTKVRAELKRSLSFDPGTYPRVFGFIEPWVQKTQLNDSRRRAYYLVAGLWAMNWSEGTGRGGNSIGKACLLLRNQKDSSSMDARFINLLEADEGQLPNRLRQIVSLLKEIPIDFRQLLDDVVFWGFEDKRIQIRWAKEYFGGIEIQ